MEIYSVSFHRLPSRFHWISYHQNMEGLKMWIMYSFWPFEDVGGRHSCSWSKWQLPEQRDRYQWAITPHSDYMAHLSFAGEGKEHSSSKEIPQISSVEANLRDERLLKENTAGKAGKHHKHIYHKYVGGSRMYEYLWWISFVYQKYQNIENLIVQSIHTKLLV